MPSECPAAGNPAPHKRNEVSPVLPAYDVANVKATIILCLNCDRAVMLAPFRVPEGHYLRPNNVLNSLAGALLTPQGAAYCPSCAGSIQICRVCGCTDRAGCQAGCWWVSADLCSECKARMTPERSGASLEEAA
jgi:hypothetical protein